MAESSKTDRDLDETKRIMERMLKTPPNPHDSDKRRASQPETKKAKPAKVSPSSSSKR